MKKTLKTMLIKTKTNRKPNVDVYFWLGAYGDLEPLTAEEFANREKQDRQAKKDYYNPGVTQN